MKAAHTTRMMALALATTAAMLAGCAGGTQTATAQRETPLEQAHSLEVVRLRAQDLTPGMTRTEVFLLLGSPAAYRGDTWVYRDGDTELVVAFDGDRYAGHQTH